MKDQSETRENTRPLSVQKESYESIKSVSTIVSPTVCQAHTDIASEEVTSKSEISKGSNTATPEGIKLVVTVVLPIADSCIVSS